jgi:hypothetical protein
MRQQGYDLKLVKETIHSDAAEMKARLELLERTVEQSTFEIKERIEHGRGDAQT